MKKLTWMVASGAVGFALAVFVMRFVLATGGDTTIKLATSAPPIPVAGAPAAGASAASSVDAAQPANASATETGPASGGGTAADAATAPTAPVAAQPVAAAADGPFHFKADPAQSSTKILVTQTGVLGDALLVANGSNVSGDIFLTRDGKLGDAPSAFQVDMRTLRSSDSELSSFLKGQLEATNFPFGQFTVASTSGIPANYLDGPEFTFTMTGPLTMHGRTKSITWTARARQSGEFLTFAADADFLMTDYGWTPPNYGVAWAKNSVHIQVTVISRKDASAAGELVRSNVPATSATTAAGSVDPATVAPSTAGVAPTLSSSAPVLSSPAGTPGVAGDAPAAQTSASSLDSMLGGLSTLLTGNGGGLPSFSIDDLMKMLGGLGGGGNNSLFGR